jgi:hypothetical protein
MEFQVKKIGSFNTKGKGKIYTFQMPYEVQVKDLKGKYVKISNGEEKVEGTVEDIERFATYVGDVMVHKNEPVGILLK